MGLGMVIDCERCGQQLYHPDGDAERKLCGKCNRELRKYLYDVENGYINPNQ